MNSIWQTFRIDFSCREPIVNLSLVVLLNYWSCISHKRHVCCVLHNFDSHQTQKAPWKNKTFLGGIEKRMENECMSLGFVSCLQVLRGLGYLRDKHQIMHRGKGGVWLHWISPPLNPALLLFTATAQTLSETVCSISWLTLLHITGLRCWSRWWLGDEGMFVERFGAVCTIDLSLQMHY